MIVSIKRHTSCKYNLPRRLNIRFIRSKNIMLYFIASSFRTSVSYLSPLRAILYCSNNSSLFAILMHGTRISNRLNILYKVQIYLSYSTSANHYGSLTFVKYKNLLFAFIGLNYNSIFAITAHKTLRCCLSFNI